jgi:hypothetical protein
MVGNSQRAAQLRTMAAILRATSYAIIGFYVLTQILGALGVSLGPFIASAGVIGLGISFGAQSIFKDMLTGIFILIEDQYSVGDTIKIAGLTGTVEDLSLRVTKPPRRRRHRLHRPQQPDHHRLQPLPRLRRRHPQRLRRRPRRSRPRHGRPQELAAQVRKDEAFKDIVIADPDIPGVDKISGYEVVYPINVRVQVNQRDGVMRELRRRVLLAFAKERSPSAPPTSTR